ncbi:MAG TPA: CsbD family protein [Oculatellaceae cyanobacterium]|jgi:uncharacterized protein YjbJ (UPF0337 family)
MFTTTELKGNWHILKGQLKQKFGELTDDDLMYVDGQEEELYGRIERRIGKTREEVRKLIDDMLR